MKLDRSLRLALITLLKDNVTVKSWGISNINIKPTILTFDVDGMKFKGTVSIEVSGTSKYTISIGHISYANCIPNNMVRFIDEKIEYTADYTIVLGEWIRKKEI